MNHRLKYIFLILYIVFFIAACLNYREIKLPLSFRIDDECFIAIENIKKEIIDEIKNKPKVKNIDAIIVSINKRLKRNILQNNTEKCEDYIINPKLEKWKAFISDPSSVEKSIAIYCKITLYPESSEKKYYAGTFGTVYYSSLKTPPDWDEDVSGGTNR